MVIIGLELLKIKRDSAQTLLLTMSSEPEVANYPLRCENLTRQNIILRVLWLFVVRFKDNKCLRTQLNFSFCKYISVCDSFRGIFRLKGLIVAPKLNLKRI